MSDLGSQSKDTADTGGSVVNEDSLGEDGSSSMSVTSDEVNYLVFR